ncbi:MAG: PIN domain-containing protein [Solobacterium sp.]|nr:PIN domain-containing protein [Solobacterium sp.]MDY5402016.1 PIN domain-containing protein [Erysipelotrichaceae bacterium]
MNREEFVNDSSLIWKLCETKKAIGYVSTLTFANMMYIMRKELAPDQIELVYKELCLIFEIADFDVGILEQAIQMNWKDFEDAIQSATAQKLKVDFIVTRNVKDFIESKVPSLTPTELLARL